MGVEKGTTSIVSDWEDRDGPKEGAAEQARELAQRAGCEQNPIRREHLLQRALRLNPQCAEAWMLLAQQAPSPVERADLCRRAVDASEAAALGSTGGEGAGQLWYRLEARPYIRARALLAEALADLGLAREAVAHQRTLLRLDASDGVGTRYALLGRLLKLRMAKAALGLLEAFPDETSPLWSFGEALLCFLQEGDSDRASELLCTALLLDSATGALLCDEDENTTGTDLREMREAWQSSPEALDWLRETLANALETQQSTFEVVPPPRQAPLSGAVDRQETVLGAKEGEVLRLLEQRIEGDERAGALGAAAEALWLELCEHACLTIRKPAVYAAALEYLLRCELGESVSQAAIAKACGVHVSSVGRALTQLDELLAAQGLYHGLDNALLDQLDDALLSNASPLAEMSVLPLDRDSIAELGSLAQSDEVWLGACRPAPFQVLEPHPHRPTIALWYGKSCGTIIGQELYGPTVPPHALFHALIQAIFAPLDGNPRRPKAIQIEDPELAEELQLVMAPLKIAVHCGELEGFEALMSSLERFVAHQTPSSYLGEEVQAELVARFFSAAAALRRATPWAQLDAAQVLTIDINRWSRQQVCVSVLGADGSQQLDRGLLIFASLEDYRNYFRHAALSEIDGAIVGAPVELLSLVFEAGAELHTSQRREVFKHGWEVVGPEDFPLLLRFDPEGRAKAPTPDDYRLATACGEAVAGFCAQPLRAGHQSQEAAHLAAIPLSCSDELSEVNVQMARSPD